VGKKHLVKTMLQNRTNTCILIISLILACDPGAALAQTGSVASSYKPVVGQPHPDFSLPNIQDSSRIKLSDYRGKKVLLLHFASW